MTSSIINDSNDLPALPLLASKPARGFAAQADDHLEHHLDLNQYIIQHPAATFFVRAEGDSMLDVGILDGDLLVVDRALTPEDNAIVLAVVDGEFMVKRLRIIEGQGFLYPANNKYKPLSIAGLVGLQLWGVVTHAIHDVRTS